MTVDEASFIGAIFARSAQFNGATFGYRALWDKATFQGNVSFEFATFENGASFRFATFQGPVSFQYADDHRHPVYFDRATFQGSTWFQNVQGLYTFDEARVLHLDNPDLYWLWPDGFTVRPDPADPIRGTVVPAAQAKEPEPAVPPSDPTDSGSGTG